MTGMLDCFDMSGRIAFVTGAGQGVGRQIAHHFAEAGAAMVVVNDYFADRAEAVAAEICSKGGRAVGVACDVSDYPAVRAAMAAVAGEHGPVSILVNNAGNAGPEKSVADYRPFWETEPADWQHWTATNYWGVLNCTRAALPGMVGQDYGRIVTVISDAGRVGEPHLAVYSAAKAGAAGFMRAIAKATGRHGITANCISLAGVNTPGVKALIPTEEALNKILKQYVIRRFAEPEEVAMLVLFLSSGAAGWITGQTYPINGGYSFNQ